MTSGNIKIIKQTENLRVRSGINLIELVSYGPVRTTLKIRIYLQSMGDSEINQFESSFHQQEVCWFEVAMDDSLLMDHVNSFQHLSPEPLQFSLGDFRAVFSKETREVDTATFHHQDYGALFLA